ncbi:COG4315 family predicted lipoprotein [Streptomyces cyaneofuscatus]|uniref:COG4315 family predicted lipoprotein n=1 Tax=Streptomyces cyaneofuscatus TaxID=66883 RepID=UPI0033B302DE
MAAATAAIALALTACAGDPGGSPARAAPPQPNSNTDFDGTFLAGTATENGAQPGTGDFAPPQQSGTVARRWVQISADPTDRSGGPLRNGAGRTLYFFDRDTPAAGTSACEGECARVWPPVVVDPKGTVFVDRLPESAIGHFVRRDGLTQLTVAGRPLYRYAGDTAPGQVRGHGLEGIWFVAAASGRTANVSGGPESPGALPGRREIPGAGGYTEGAAR